MESRVGGEERRVGRWKELRGDEERQRREVRERESKRGRGKK